MFLKYHHCPLLYKSSSCRILPYLPSWPHLRPDIDNRHYQQMHHHLILDFNGSALVLSVFSVDFLNYCHSSNSLPSPEYPVHPPYNLFTVQPSLHVPSLSLFFFRHTKVQAGNFMFSFASLPSLEAMIHHHHHYHHHSPAGKLHS